jgi:hypothetical protein
MLAFILMIKKHHGIARYGHENIKPHIKNCLVSLLNYGHYSTGLPILPVQIFVP